MSSAQRIAVHTSATLSENEFRRVREWFYRRTGIHFSDTKRYFVDKRVQACVARAGQDFEVWFGQLRSGGRPELAQQLINELTVNETYFLREDHQFDTLIDTVLPTVLTHHGETGNRTPIRILSLPCSTGEEPYSIGIRLVEEWPDIEHVDVEIVAADIDTTALDRAREAVYGTRSMQRVSASLRTRWFEPAPDGDHRVTAALRDAIQFRHTNISDPVSMRALGMFDVIFCRNLLIYFDEPSARLAVENLFGVLRPGGFLFLGHSESMSRISSVFEPVRLRDDIVYQRPRTGRRA